MPFIFSAPSKFIEELEKTGEDEVRAALARSDEWIVHAGRIKVVEGWLKSKEDERSAAALARSEEREKNSISIARRAERWALWANIIAIIAIAIAAKDQICAFILFILK